MGETEHLHVYDIGLFGRAPEPQNQYHWSLETPKNTQKPISHKNFFGIDNDWYILELKWKKLYLKDIDIFIVSDDIRN